MAASRATPMKNLRLQIKFTCLLGIVSLAATAFAVSPPPDGGYPNQNTAEGDDALFSLTTGPNNTAIGFQALYNNTTGHENTATGVMALASNTSGEANNAIGFAALSSNTTGFGNTANGVDALYHNTIGGENTASGLNALTSNTNGSFNTANGYQALAINATGSENTASGASALLRNTTGVNNTADGVSALPSNTTGNYNTAIGVAALNSNTTGNYNTAIGSNAAANLTTGSNNIDIFDRGVAGESDTIRIGSKGVQNATFIAGIRGVVVTRGQAVLVDANGKLGVKGSSSRFKEAIKPMDKSSREIFSLRPVRFRYKEKLDSRKELQFGLIAEEVAKVAPDLVVRDEAGQPFSVRYEEVNAMLLNEFLKEHRKVEEQGHKLAAQDNKSQEQDAIISELKSALALQQKQIGMLTSQMQKVSDHLAMSQSPPPMLVENR